MAKALILFLVALLGIVYFRNTPPAASVAPDKIRGANFVAPSREVQDTCLHSLRRINAAWIALNPYAFAREGQPEVVYDVERQWWGEKPAGVKACIAMARRQNLKVMVKPHVWVRGQGWAGDFTLDSEEKWQRWEANYAKYILDYARLAETTGAEMFCIGTEYRQAVKQRPAFWKNLITQVRQVYWGPLTYAANWDEYATVPFWNQLDYVGLDAYFPLSESTTPSVAELRSGWQREFNVLQTFSRRIGKPVLFTEYGYRSVDKTAGKQWELPDSWNSTAPANLAAQANAYEALYQTFWHQPWFAGGFLWKWYDDYARAGGPGNNDYTPQRKPAEQVIARYYKGKP